MNNLLQCRETFQGFNGSYLMPGFPRWGGTTVASSSISVSVPDATSFSVSLYYVPDATFSSIAVLLSLPLLLPLCLYLMFLVSLLRLSLCLPSVSLSLPQTPLLVPLSLSLSLTLLFPLTLCFMPLMPLPPLALSVSVTLIFLLSLFLCRRLHFLFLYRCLCPWREWVEICLLSVPPCGKELPAWIFLLIILWRRCCIICFRLRPPPPHTPEATN